MNDKFMCLCFPEFSGKYVCDDTMCLYNNFFVLAARYYSRTERGEKKSFKHSIEHFAPHRRYHFIARASDGPN